MTKPQKENKSCLVQLVTFTWNFIVSTIKWLSTTYLTIPSKGGGYKIPGIIIAAMLMCVCMGFSAIFSDVDTPTDETPLVETATLETEITATFTPEPKEASTSTPTRPAQPSPTPMPTETPIPDMVKAKVTRIIDGDTIEVEIDGETYPLRYIGIDSPEPSTQEPLANDATEANRQLVEGQTVYLEADTSDVDPYDRLLRYVYLADGTFVNAELVRQGMAVAKAYPPDTKYHEILVEKEQAAVEAQVGLWEPTPEPSNCWRAQYLADVTIPDGTWIDLGKQFTKEWRVRNTGTCTWENITLVAVSATKISSTQININRVEPGDEVVVRAELIAPSENGRYSSEYRFQTPDGQQFGSLTVVINAGEKPVVAAPTSAPATAAPPAAGVANVLIIGVNKRSEYVVNLRAKLGHHFTAKLAHWTSGANEM